MRKSVLLKSLLVFALVLISGSVWGETKTIIVDGSVLTETATTAATDKVIDGLTFTFSDGAKLIGSTGTNKFTSNAILIGKTGKYIYNKTAIPGKITKFEVYSNQGASKKVSVGINFSSKSITSFNANAANTYSATLETLDHVYDCSESLPADAKYFWFQITNNNNAQVEFRITYEEGGNITPTVDAPSFSPAGGYYSEAQTVTLSCATPSADIYYTLDGTEPTTEGTKYTGSISVSETTTIKAIAAAEGLSNSAVVTATYTIATPKTIAQARALGEGEVFTKGVVTSSVGTTAFIQDATAAICVFGKELTVGDMITVQGTLDTFKGLLEIKNPTVNVLSQNNSILAEVMTVQNVKESTKQGWLVRIENAKVMEISEDGKSTTIAQDDNSIVVRAIPSSVDYAVGDFITFTGNIGCYEVVQIVNPSDITVQKPTVAIPTFNPEPGTYTEPVTVTISCTTEGAEIWYAINPSGAFVLYQQYSTPITISATSTIKAYSSFGDLNSDEASATYTIEVPKVAVLPFAFDGGRDDIANTDGLTQEGLGTNYSNSPYLKFDHTDDYVLLHFDEAPGKLFFDVKGNPGSSPWSGTFKVQTSADGVTFTDLKTYTEFGNNVLSEEFTDLASDVRYIKWVYTEKVSGNVALGNIYLERYTTIATPTITPDGGSFFGPVEVKIECETPGVTIEYFFENGEGGVTLSSTYTGPITISESKTLVAYAHIGDDYSNDASATFTIVELAAAELPFAYDGDGTGTLPDGLVQEGLGTYSSSPAMKFDGTGDYLLLHFNETPGTLSFNVKGNDFSGGTFTVQTSTDGVTFTDLESYTEFDDIQNEEFDLASDVRYIKWVYTEKASGNVALGNIKLTKYSTVATPTFDPNGGTFVESVEVAIACETPDATIEYYFENGEGGVTLSSKYEGPIIISESTTLVAYAYVGDDYSNDATATFTIETPMTTIEAIFAKATEVGTTATDCFVTFNSWYVSGVKGKNAYVTDGEKGFIIYQADHGFEVGDLLSGTVPCKVQLYKGSAELTEITGDLSVEKEGLIPPFETTIADLSGVNTGAVVTIENVTYDGTNFVDDDGNTLKPYNLFITLPDLESGKQYNVTGVFVLYNETKEIAPHSADDFEEIVSAEPSITVTPATYDVPGLAGEFELPVTIENLDNPDGVGVTFYEDAEGNTETTYDWITASADAESVMLYYEDNDIADRTAYLRVFVSVGTDVFSSNVVTINQAKYVAPSVATLPFVFDGGLADIAETDGLTQEGLGTDYGSSPKLKFNDTGDYLLLQIEDKRPGVLTFDIKGMTGGGSQAWSGEFSVLISDDGVNFTELATYTELSTSTTQSEQFKQFDLDFENNVRYIKWVFTEKGTGNVALGNIKVFEWNANSVYLEELTNISVIIEDEDGVIENSAEVMEGQTITLTVEPAVGYMFETINVTTVSDDEVELTSLSENRYSFVMPGEDVYISATATEDPSTLYTLATSIEPGKHYIIVGKNDTEFYAMGKDKGNNRAAVGVRKSASGICVDPVANPEEGVYEFVVTGCSAGYVFYDEASTGYLYAASSSANQLKTTATPDDNAKWTISFGTNGSATIKAQGDKERNLMRFNSSGSNALFACYGSGQQDVYLYVRDGDESSEPESFYKTITDAGWATLCLPFTAETPEGVTVYAVTGADDSVLENEVIEEGVLANTGVLLKGDAGMVKFVKNDGLKLHVPEGNCLVGTTEGATFEGDELGGTYYYILANDASKGIGFYWQKGTEGTSAHCEPYKAVLELHYKGAPAIGFRLDDATMVEAVKATEENAVIYDLTGRRVTNVTRGIYIVNGKKVMVK